MSERNSSKALQHRRAASAWLGATLLWCLLVTGLALLQPAGPINASVPVSTSERQGLAWWLTPLEVNPHRRLTQVSAVLNAVHFSADGQRGWAVGDGGAVVATRDGGQTWAAQTSSTYSQLRSVHFSADGQQGWAAGEDGAVITTQDGGQRWAAQTAGTNSQLRSLHFSADGRRGWAVGDGGTLITTQNGGQTWAAQTSGIYSNLRSLYFSADGRQGWAVGSTGTVIATQDGGQRWDTQVSGTNSLLHSLHFNVDGKRGWAVGESGVVIATLDGGQRWTVQSSGTDLQLRSVHFSADGQRGWAVGGEQFGTQGIMIATQDGGQRWTAQASGLRTPLRGVHFSADGQHGWAVGSSGAVIATQDGGQRWAAQTSGSNSHLRSAHFSADGRLGWAVGEAGAVIASQDGGQRWAAQTSGTRSSLNSLHFNADGQRGWAVGEAGGVIATRDGGQRWAAQTSGTRLPLNSVHFSADGQRGWAVGQDGAVIATQDGGQRWDAQTSGTRSQLHSVHFSADGQRGWAVGYDGTVIATQTGGQQWAAQTSGTHAQLNSLQFSADGQRGWAAGYDGTVIATQNGGQDWAVQTSGTSSELHSLHIDADGQRGWAVGNDGSLLATQDGGHRWAVQPSGTSSRLNSLHFGADGQRGWAVGNEGSMIATRNGGLTWADPRPYARHPAPWFWLALLLAGPMLAAALRHWMAAGRATERMADLAATDAALTRPEQDRLNFAPLAAGISRFMRNPATEPPLTLAITGDWGSGKSSLMGLLCADLRQHGLRPVWFNAWHHQKEDHLFAALLGALSRKAVPPWLSLDGLSFRLRLLWARSRKHALFSLALCAVVAAGLTMQLRAPDRSALTRLLDQMSSQIDHLNPAAKPAAASFTMLDPARGEPNSPLAPWLAMLAVAGATLAALRKALTAFGADPAALLAGSAQAMTIGRATEQNSFRTRFAEQFGEVTAALPERLVIVIDDLDRCRPEAVLEIMEAVNFLTSSGPCFVIFGMATDKVQAALAVAFERIAKELAEEAPTDTDKEAAARKQRRAYAANYLHKLINLEIKVPTTKDFEAWKLLTSEPEPHKQRALWRQGLRTLQAQWQWAAIAAALGLGVWGGAEFAPAGPTSSTPPVAAPVLAAASAPAPEPTAASSVANKKAPDSETGPPSAAPAFVLPGQTSMMHIGLSLGGLAAGAVLASLLMLRAAARRHSEATDSEDFRRALKVWTELVREHGGTPRAVKRFGNKLRYFEMLQQDQRRDQSLLDEARQRWQARSRSAHKAAAAPASTASGAKNRQIATPQLVALGALTEAMGPAWLGKFKDDLAQGYATAAYHEEVLERYPHCSTALAIIARHQAEFNTPWPPSLEEVMVFARLLDGVRLPGEAEELAMRRSEAATMAEAEPTEPYEAPSAESASATSLHKQAVTAGHQQSSPA
ncbi:MAG: hypothetical protein IV107_10795 [Paucibacter sp.]|nr:hypothetical protein [Roseateles sp.]